MLRTFVLTLVLLLDFVGNADARPFRERQIPNGDCDTCHFKAPLFPTRTLFGGHVEVHLDGRNVDWAALFNLDSDGDGFSNGHELGDMCGAWRAGAPPERTTDISDPSDPLSIPPGPPGPACECGNGVVDAGEECDDGDLVHANACSNDCEETGCGDGVVDPGEPCDDGNDVDVDACLTTCVPAKCGDGVVWDGVEQCDDGNFANDDLCLNDCTLPGPGPGPGPGPDPGPESDPDPDPELDQGSADLDTVEASGCTGTRRHAATPAAWLLIFVAVVSYRASDR